MTKLSAPICKAARALLNMTQLDLAECAGLGIATIRRFELENLISLESEEKIIACLKAKLVFIKGLDGEIIGVAQRRTVKHGKRRTLP